jgi:hypothetical protein
VLQFQTENYYIIKIKGKIYNESSGKLLKQGDAIKFDDKLKFTQKEAIALVISDSRGRFTLRYPERPEESVGALTVFVKNALTTSQLNNLSTRSLASGGSVNHLDTYLGNKTFNVIGNELQINLSKKHYTVNKENKIVARYELNNQKHLAELSTENQTIILSRSKFELPDNDVFVLKKVNLYQLYVPTGKKKLIASAGIRFIDEKQLEKEFLIIIEKFNKGEMSKAKLNALLLGYFNDFYGKTDDLKLNKYTAKLIRACP